jgi:ankyrin repeat protein
VYPKFHPIHSASRSGSWLMAKKILNVKPACLNIKDFKGLTPLHHAVMYLLS